MRSEIVDVERMREPRREHGPAQLLLTFPRVRSEAACCGPTEASVVSNPPRSQNPIGAVTLWFAIIAVCSSGCSANPGMPSNTSPQILSIEVFPAIIGASDSAIVYCRAVDSDGDSLFYDWTADGRLTLQGVPPFIHSRYDSRSSTQIFYPAAVGTPSDTAWIEAAVRDHRGGMASMLVRLIVRTSE